MFYSLSEYVDAIWAYSSRTVDAGTPAASDGTYLDDVGYAVWTYPSRTDDGGVSTNLIAVPLASGTTVGTPAIGQTHVLTAQGLRSGSSVGTPAIGQTHVLTAQGLRSGSSVGTPELVCLSPTVLEAAPLRSGSTVGSPALSSYRVIKELFTFGSSLDSAFSLASSVETPTFSGASGIESGEVSFGSAIETPALALASSITTFNDMVPSRLQAGFESRRTLSWQPTYTSALQSQYQYLALLTA